MKGLLQKLFTISIVVACSLIASGQAGALEVEPTPIQKPSSPLVVTEFMTTSEGFPAFVQIYNNSDNLQFLPDWEITVDYAGGAGRRTYELPNGYLEPGKRLVLSDGVVASGEAVARLGGMLEQLNEDDEVRLSSRKGAYRDEIFPLGQGQFGARYGLKLTSQGNIPSTRNYDILKDQAVSLISDGVYIPADNFALAPVEILSRSKDCSPLQDNTSCGDYVKFYNNTKTPVDFSGLRLRFGYKGQSATKQNSIPLGGVVEPGSYAVFNASADGNSLSLPNSGAYVWLEDIYGVVTYQNTVIQYPDNGSKKDMSWAMGGDGVWTWASPNPNGVNKPIVDDVDSSDDNAQKPCPAGQERNPETNRCRKVQVAAELTPCPIGQERNPETGRCRKITSNSNSLKPCAPDEYRHPETNRCRKLTTAASNSLTPCKPGQERNPETGRCRKIAASTNKELKPCPAGQERNPLTNRCRKVQTSSSSNSQSFAPELTSASKDTVAAWWVMGGLGMGAVGYAGWEWRRELANLGGKLKNLITGGKS